MYFNYKNLSVYYTARGKGKNLLLLHGWGADGRVFENIISRYEKYYRVITPDFPPFGMSGELNTDYTVSGYKDIVKALLDELDIHKTDIICHSFGCRVALKFINDYPEVIDKLIICSGAGLPYKKTFKKTFKKICYKSCKFLAKRGIINKNRLKSFFSKDYNNLPENMKKTFVNIINEDLTEYAKNIKCPVLIIWGKNDKETPLYMAKMFNNLIENSNLSIINGGHYGFLDDYSGFVNAADKFLN